MTRVFSSLLFVCMGMTLNAQFMQSMDNYRAKKNATILFDGGYSSTSNFLNNAVFQASRTGGHLENGLLLDIENNLNEKNRLGLVANAGFGTSFRLKRIGSTPLHDVSLFFNFSDNAQFNGDIPDDLYRLVAFGNKSFEGDSADISGAAIRAYRYHKYSVGLISKTLNGHTFAAAFNFYNTKTLAEASFGESYVITGPQGRYIDASLQGFVHVSDTNNRNYLQGLGQGYGLDLMYSRDLSMTKDSALSGYFRIEIRDLGFLQTGEESMKYDLNSRYTFDGITVDNLFNPDSAAIQEQIPDSIEETVVSRSHIGGIRMTLPTLFSVSAFQNVSQRWGLGATVRYQLASAYVPQVELQQRLYLWGTQQNFGAVTFYESVGGYSDFQLGAQFTWQHDVVQFAIGSRNLDGILAPKGRQGSSAYLQCNFSF